MLQEISKEMGWWVVGWWRKFRRPGAGCLAQFGFIRTDRKREGVQKLDTSWMP